MSVGMNLRGHCRSQRFGAQVRTPRSVTLYPGMSRGMVAMSAEVPSCFEADRDKTCYPSPSMRSGRNLSRPHFFAETRRFRSCRVSVTRRIHAFDVSLRKRGTSTGDTTSWVIALNSPPSFSHPAWHCPAACPAILNAPAQVPQLAGSPRPRSTATLRRASSLARLVARSATTSTSADWHLIRGAINAAGNCKDRSGPTAPAVFSCLGHAVGPCPLANKKGQYPCSRKS